MLAEIRSDTYRDRSLRALSPEGPCACSFGLSSSLIKERMDALSQSSIDWTAIGTLIAAGAATIAAVAARRSAKAAADAAEVTRHGALLGAIPLVVPWVDLTGAHAMNRGKSVAFNLTWKIEALPDLEYLDGGEREMVLRVDRVEHLYKPEDALATHVERDRAAGGVLISCSFAAPWGEEFTVTRELFEDRTYGRTRVLDGQSREVKIAL